MKFSTAFSQILIAGVLMAFASPTVAQQDYPNKPITVIVPYAPGGNADPLARMIGQKLTETWGQQVIVENRPGGNTIIGSEALLKSPADGYTFITVFATHVTLPFLYSNLSYDPIKDFAPVGTFASNEQMLIIHPSVPANNLKEFIALAKSKPGQLNYGSNATGGVAHLAQELFCMKAGVKIQHIPYKGGGPSLAAVLAGDVQMNFSPPMISIPLVKSGRVKAIAISGDRRLSALPEVPTFTEAGLPGMDVKVWIGILARTGTPKERIEKMSAALAKIMTMPDIKEKLINLGQDPFVTTPDQFAALLKKDMVGYGNIIKAANIKVE